MNSQKIQMCPLSALQVSSVALGVAIALLSPRLAVAQSDACESLESLVNRAGDQIKQSFSDAPEVAKAGDTDACRDYLVNIDSEGGISADSASQTVNVDEDVSIEGNVRVKLPDPEVSVEQDAAEISIERTPPDVSVTQKQPSITIRQAKPIIRVQMAQPTITVEQPAPEIRITMPEPGVDVASVEPKVNVIIPEPRVTVRQGDPSLSVDIEAADAEGQSGGNTQLERSDENGVMVVKATGSSENASEPKISFAESDMNANVNITGAEPEVNYEAAEPEIQVVQTEGEPTVEIIDSGEPKIMVSKAGQADEQPGETSSSQQLADSEKKDPKAVLAETDAKPSGAKPRSINAGAVSGMAVVNGDGEELGEVDRIVKNGGDTFVIVSHGGWFLGLNDKEIALPMMDTYLQDEQLVLRGLSEEQIEKLPEYDYANEQEVGAEESIELPQVK